MTNEEINAKVIAIRKLEADAEKIKQEVDRLKDELKAELDARKVDSLSTGLHNIHYNVYSKKGVDSEKLKAEGLYDRFTKETIVTQFRITDVKIV